MVDHRVLKNDSGLKYSLVSCVAQGRLEHSAPLIISIRFTYITACIFLFIAGIKTTYQKGYG